MRTVAALAAALGLVAVAVVVRNVLDDDDGAGGSAAGRDTVLVCPPELGDACRAVAGDVTVRTEPATTTATALAAAGDDGGTGDDGDRGTGDDGGDSDPGDVWLAPAPWAGLVADERERAGVPPLLGEPSPVIARSPVVLVVWADRAAALEAGACGGPVEWRCLGEAADRRWEAVGGQPAWGAVNVGLTDPASATGLVVLGGATSGFFGSADYAANDLGGELTAWLGAIGAQAASASADVVNEMLTRGAGRFSAVGVLEAEAAGRVANRDDVRVIYPAPVATADLVAIPIGDAAGAAADIAEDDDLRRALASEGWRVDGQNEQPGLPGEDLPEDAGLPPGGVLAALLARWTEVTGTG